MPCIPVRFQSQDPQRMWILLGGTYGASTEEDKAELQKTLEIWPGLHYTGFVEFVLLKPGETPPTAEQLGAADAAATGAAGKTP
jgi:hypothetical protein